jgi:hypothetical protein
MEESGKNAGEQNSVPETWKGNHAATHDESSVAHKKIASKGFTLRLNLTIKASPASSHISVNACFMPQGSPQTSWESTNAWLGFC